MLVDTLEMNTQGQVQTLELTLDQQSTKLIDSIHFILLLNLFIKNINSSQIEFLQVSFHMETLLQDIAWLWSSRRRTLITSGAIIRFSEIGIGG